MQATWEHAGPAPWPGIRFELEDLVSRARQGDVEAFEALYRQNVGRVYALCLRLTANTARAEEHTQETFLRAWRRLESFRGESKFTSWLHQVAVNVVMTAFRSSAGKWDDASVALESPAAAPEETPEARFDLERAAAALPPRARTVFVLHDIEGYKHTEIATLTGISPGTSKSQLHRARRLLREALKK